MGKTTLAGVIANEMGVNIRITSGPAIEKPGDLAALLTNLNPGISSSLTKFTGSTGWWRKFFTRLWRTMPLTSSWAKGRPPTPSVWTCQSSLLVGATTRAGQLSSLRDRFGVSLRLELYTTQELSRIVARSATLLGMEIDPQGAQEIAARSRGTPRIANRFLRRVRDFAQVCADGVITREAANLALERLEVDRLGLDAIDRRMLTAIIRNYGGGPVGLETLAATIGEEAVTLEDVYEPYQPGGRVLPPAPLGGGPPQLAYEHLGLPFTGQTQLSL